MKCVIYTEAKGGEAWDNEQRKHLSHSDRISFLVEVMWRVIWVSFRPGNGIVNLKEIQELKSTPDLANGLI